MKIGVALLLGSIVCSASSAAEPGNINRFELEFSHNRIPLADHTLLDVNGLGIRYSESSTLPLRLTLALGRQEVSHDGDPLSAGFQPDGFYVGINAAAASPRWHSLQLGAELGYSYHSASQEFNQQQLEIDWQRTEARGWLAFHIDDAVKLYGCAIATNINGHQSLNGNSPSRINFSNEQHSGYCGGMEIKTGNDGYIGFEAQGGAQRGGMIYFGKRYLF